jgi:hypothetical protein
LKAAFNIIPAKFENEHHHLLIEAGYHGISFSWFTKAPFEIKGLAVYHFNNISAAADAATAIESVLWNNPVFEERIESVSICYDFNESLLVPAAFCQPGTEEAMLKLVFEHDDAGMMVKEEISKLNITHIYAVPKRIENALTGKFPGARSFHSSSLQLEKFNPEGDHISCIFFHNSIKLFLYKAGEMQAVQHFHYHKPVDVAYHMLNCCARFNMKPSEITLQLSGMIDANSNLYNELLKYFLNIAFDEPVKDIELHERVKFYPAHFFSHLTVLMSCV